MKRKKRLSIYVLAMSLLILFSGIGGAAEPIVPIIADLTGTITIHKLAVDSLDDYQTPATGDEQDVTGMTPIEHIEFTVIRVGDDDTDPGTAGALTGDERYEKKVSTNDEGEAVFRDLEIGTYLIKETPSAAVKEPVADFLVQVPMTSAEGDRLIYEIHVYPKNVLAGAPGVNMSVGANENKTTSIAAGETAEWIITAEVPLDIAGAKTYEIKTQVDKSLLYADNSASVTVTGSGETTSILEEDTHYQVAVSGGDIAVTVTAEGMAYLGTFVAEDFKPSLTVRFSSKLHTDPEILSGALGKKLQADASLLYVDSLQQTYVSQVAGDTLPYIYTGGAEISKIDRAGSGALAGAAFKIYRTSEDAQAGTNALQNPAESGDWEVITGADGTAIFYGLAYGEPGTAFDEGTRIYYLVETRAPAGYNLLAAPLEVTINAVSHDNPVVVRNSAGLILPVTGGMGTILFTVIGLILIGLALLFYFRSRKQLKHAENRWEPEDDA